MFFIISYQFLSFLMRPSIRHLKLQITFRAAIVAIAIKKKSNLWSGNKNGRENWFAENNDPGLIEYPGSRIRD